jgi:hypothetical protein
MYDWSTHESELERLREELVALGPWALPTLREATKRPCNHAIPGIPVYRLEAMAALAKIAGDDAVEHLLPALDDEAKPVVRAAAQALAELPCTDPRVRAQTVEALARVVRDASRSDLALHSLAQLDPNAALQALSEISGRRSAELKTSIAYALSPKGKLATLRDDPRARSLVADLQDDRDPRIRAYVSHLFSGDPTPAE